METGCDSERACQTCKLTPLTPAGATGRSQVVGHRRGSLQGTSCLSMDGMRARCVDVRTVLIASPEGSGDRAREESFSYPIECTK